LQEAVDAAKASTTDTVKAQPGKLLIIDENKHQGFL